MSMINRSLTLSFASGRGSIEHNRREKNGNIRTYGMRDRREWNVALHERNVRDVIENVIAVPLQRYNERMLLQRHPGRMLTVDEWIKKHTRKGTQQAYCEFVVQLGNRLTGCTYLHRVDDAGYPVDNNGKRIWPWQTRKKPEPVMVNGSVVESEISKVLKDVYYDILVDFERENPGMVVVGAYVHADEAGGVHMHINCVCLSHTKNGIGWGLSKTGCIGEILTKLGIRFGNSRKDNALKTWTKRMRELCTRVAARHGIMVVDGHCAGRQHKTTDAYIRDENIRNNYLDDMFRRLTERERELDETAQRLNARQNRMDTREGALWAKESALEQTSEELRKQQDKLEKVEGDLAYRRSLVQSQQLANTRREEWLDSREADVAAREKAVAETVRKIQIAEKQIRQSQSVVRMIQAEHPEWLSERGIVLVDRGSEKEKKRNRRA